MYFISILFQNWFDGKTGYMGSETCDMIQKGTGPNPVIQNY